MSEVGFSTYTTRSVTKLTVDMAVPSQQEDDSERACTADVWQRGAGVYSGRWTAWSRRVQQTFDSVARANVQRTFDSVERACTQNERQRDNLRNSRSFTYLTIY